MPAQKKQSRSGDLLSAAHGTEINWDLVPQVLRGQILGQATYIYIIGEQDDGPFKVGYAADPIRRLRELQIGNPRRLKIEALIIGDRSTERLFHAYLAPHVIGGKRRGSELNVAYVRDTEWFKAEAREDIVDAFALISGHQRFCLDTQLTPEVVNEHVGRFMADLGYEIRIQDTVNQLANGGGYLERQIR